MPLDLTSIAARIVVAATIGAMTIARVVHQRWAGESRSSLARHPGARRSVVLPVVGGAPWALLTIGWVAGVIPTGWRSTPGEGVWPILGAVISVASGILYVRVHEALGRNFSIALRIRDDHTLVTSGPYAHVRHPMYTAGIGLMLGVSLASGSVWIAGTGALYAGVLVHRVRAEEALLTDAFGSAYETYRARTGAILPRWR